MIVPISPRWSGVKVCAARTAVTGKASASAMRGGERAEV